MFQLDQIYRSSVFLEIFLFVCVHQRFGITDSELLLEFQIWLELFNKISDSKDPALRKYYKNILMIAYSRYFQLVLRDQSKSSDEKVNLLQGIFAQKSYSVFGTDFRLFFLYNIPKITSVVDPRELNFFNKISSKIPTLLGAFGLSQKIQVSSIREYNLLLMALIQDLIEKKKNKYLNF